MTCRVARKAQDDRRMDVAYCCQCGAANPDEDSTSQTGGPYLCPTCARSTSEGGTRMEDQTRSAM